MNNTIYVLLENGICYKLYNAEHIIFTNDIKNRMYKTVRLEATGTHWGKFDTVASPLRHTISDEEFFKILENEDSAKEIKTKMNAVHCNYEKEYELQTSAIPEEQQPVDYDGDNIPPF